MSWKPRFSARKGDRCNPPRSGSNELWPPSLAGCVAFHPDCPMVCVLPAGHDGDHSVDRLSATWQGKPVRLTWPQSADDNAPATTIRQRAAFDALDEVLFRCVDVGLSVEDVFAHIAGHEISESAGERASPPHDPEDRKVKDA
jgi:hypothetical protein